jgi:hypothetical protein
MRYDTENVISDEIQTIYTVKRLAFEKLDEYFVVNRNNVINLDEYSYFKYADIEYSTRKNVSTTILERTRITEALKASKSVINDLTLEEKIKLYEISQTDENTKAFYRFVTTSELDNEFTDNYLAKDIKMSVGAITSVLSATGLASSIISVIAGAFSTMVAAIPWPIIGWIIAAAALIALTIIIIYWSYIEQVFISVTNYFINAAKKFASGVADIFNTIKQKALTSVITMTATINGTLVNFRAISQGLVNTLNNALNGDYLLVAAPVSTLPIQVSLLTFTQAQIIPMYYLGYSSYTVKQSNALSSISNAYPTGIPYFEVDNTGITKLYHYHTRVNNVKIPLLHSFWGNLVP